MIAEAAPAQASSVRRLSTSRRFEVILLSSRITPITPVEAIITSRWRQSKRLPTAVATRRTASAPGLPVKLLAQPALTTRARTSSPLLAASWRLHQSTGAEPTPWRVNTPAQLVPSAKRISSRSSRSCL
jgi:hypothetical protein